MELLRWLHLVGAAVWLGGLVTLTAAILVALRTLPREEFRGFVRSTGRAFAGIAVAAWLLIGVSGLFMAGSLHWPRLAVDKAWLGGLLIVATGAHTVTGMRTESRVLVMTSRFLAVLVFLGTLWIFWLGVRLAG